MRVEIKVTGSRGSGKTYLLTLITALLVDQYKHARVLNRTDAMIDGQMVEIVELEVTR